jgi:FeS assembly SUF system protein
LQTVYDPEIPVNIHELGLIYGIEIDEGGNVEIRMTLTAPGCPVAGAIVQEVEFKVGQVPGVATCRVDLVWEPPWTMDRMSEAARLQLGMF